MHTQMQLQLVCDHRSARSTISETEHFENEKQTTDSSQQNADA